MDKTARPRRPSISDVAAVAGVSRAAVSKVIRNAYGVSPAMRDRVGAAIDELGYRPRVAARALRGRTFTIGFEIPYLGNDIFTQIIRGASDRLQGTEYQLIIAPAGNPTVDDHALDALVDRQVDGIIAISPDVLPPKLESISQFVPIVLLGRHDKSSVYDVVDNDDAGGVEQIMDHLFQLGHTRIAHVTVLPAIDLPEARAPHSVRLDTYTRRMTEVGSRPQVVYIEATEQAAHDAAAELLASADAPTAIFAGHDTLAIGVLRAAASIPKSRRPAVIGYDGIEITGHPLISLTTVDQSAARMGEQAVELLLERIEGGRAKAKHVQIAPELVIRSSSGSARS